MALVDLQARAHYRHTFTTKADLITAVDTWIHRHNTIRRHSAIDHISLIN